MTLIAHYPLNGDTKDYSGYGRDLTEVSAISYESGVIGNALSVNGQYVTSSEVSEYLHGKPEASIAMWVKKNDLSYGIFQLSGFQDTNGNLYPYQTNDRIYMDTFRTNRIGPITVTNVNEWHHLVITQTAGLNGWKLYQNGFLVTQQTADETVSTNYGVFEIGRNSGNRYANGLFNDVRIYDHALSEKEVKELAKAKVLHYKFDEQDLASKVVKDSSGFRNDGSVAVTTAPSWSEDSPVGLGGLRFVSSENDVIDVNHKIPLMDDSTVSFWANINQSGTATLGCSRTSLGKGFSIFILNGVIRWDTGDQQWSTGHEAKLNQWVHYTLVKRGNVKELYENAVLVKSTTYAGSVTDLGSSYSIGMSQVGGSGYGNPLNGTVSDYRIYATALSPEDIKELYQTRASIDNLGNLHVYEFDEVSVPAGKSIGSNGVAYFTELNEISSDDKMSIGYDGILYVNEIKET